VAAPPQQDTELQNSEVVEISEEENQQMVLANVATLILCNLHHAAILLLQEENIGWDPISLWRQMGLLAKIVVVVLFLMSGWSFAIMIDRALHYSAARSQSRAFAPAVATALKEGKIEEAIKVASSDRNKKSHLAQVVAAGLKEFKSQESSDEELEASRRALERTEAIVHAQLKRGLAGLATIGSTAPFVGLFGTVVGILNAFKGISGAKATGLAAVAGGISEALVTTAVGLFVAIPAVWMFNYFTGRVEAFDVEMENSSSELIDFFLKRRNRH
jgi:biopolymer transport protein ExbB